MVLNSLKLMCLFILCFETVSILGKPSKQGRAVSGQCPSMFIQCTSTGSCVPIQWQCDGENDCTDGTDEQNCGGSRPTLPTTTTTPFVPMTESTTTTAQRQTATGQTVFPSVTNGPDVSLPVSVECGTQYFYCRTDSACIPLEWLCDGDLDCEDGSDEHIKCSNQQNSATTSMLKASSNVVAMVTSIIPVSFGVTTDGMKDTTAVPVVSQTQSSRSPYQTQSQMKTTIKQNTVSMVTQVHSSRCPQGYYVCDSGSCQPLQWACDGEADCDDASDEKYCSGVSRPATVTQAPSTAPIVPMYQTTSPQLDTTTKPITFAPLVTSTTSVNTGSSKGASVSGSPECGSGYFYCKLDSLCIPVEWLCDADTDCSDGDDEHQKCPSTQSPPQIASTMGPPTTIRRVSTTNLIGVSRSTSIVQTHPSSLPPSGNCPTGFFSCKSTSSCSPNTWLCDGESDCADGSDEQNCGT